jgi:hypothetical protein
MDAYRWIGVSSFVPRASVETLFPNMFFNVFNVITTHAQGISQRQIRLVGIAKQFID